jgi:ornithine cyclodeaminase/alanine dehydrogenase-like protein (mu-crystallin family)
MHETLILTAADVRSLLGWDECIAAVEDAFRLHARGQTSRPASSA